MRQKNIMFSAMTTYCHYMSIMGNCLISKGVSCIKFRNWLSDLVMLMEYISSIRKIC